MDFMVNLNNGSKLNINFNIRTLTLTIATMNFKSKLKVEIYQIVECGQSCRISDINVKK